MNILIVEDEPAMLKALSDTMSRAGYGVFTAADGQEGIHIALTKHPDLIILDILMPNTNGVSVMETLRKTPWGKTVPIVILTNLEPDDKMIGTILRDQPSYYLVKASTNLDDLTEKIRDILTAPKPAPDSR